MKKILSALAAAALALGACAEIEEAKTDSVQLSTNEVAAEPEGGVYDIVVTSDSDWRVSGLCDWARPLNESGKSGETLKIEVDPSNSKEILSTQFKVFSGSAVQTVTVTSNPSFVIELLSGDKLSFKSGGSSFSIKLDSNVPDLESVFTGDGADWIMFRERTEAFGRVILKYDVLANETYKTRTTELTIKGRGKESGKITVSQNQLDAIVTDTPKIVHEGIDAGELSFEVRANVDFTFNLPDWLELKSNVKGSEEADGLTPYLITLAFGATEGSRITSIDFISNGVILLPISIKQQDPNAILFDITDKVLRQELNKKGLILSSDASTECELLGSGKTVESITLQGGWYDKLAIKTSDGLGNFPELASLHIERANVETIVLSDCKKLTSLTLSEAEKVSTIELGSCPVTSFVTFQDSGYAYDFFSSPSFTISSENLTEINISSRSSNMAYSGLCKTADVTACPKLTVLKANMYYSGYYGEAFLEELKISQAQKDAADAGTLALDVNAKTTVTVVK